LHLNDFGTVKSTIKDENRLSSNTGTNPGTAEYLAPEIINAKTFKPTDISK
jgi:serine/threonine protein kinase